MENVNILPIGTVVKLKEAEKRVMIIGILQQLEDKGIKKLYEYIGIPYPEGYLGEESTILFNQEDIEGISVLGFNDYERQIFIDSIESALEDFEKQKNGKNIY